MSPVFIKDYWASTAVRIKRRLWSRQMTRLNGEFWPWPSAVGREGVSGATVRLNMRGSGRPIYITLQQEHVLVALCIAFGALVLGALWLRRR